MVSRNSPYVAAAVVIGLLHASTAVGFVNVAEIGAKIDETLATTLIAVNPGASGASDANAGTEASPVVTIKRGLQLAVEANRTGVGVRVRIAAGTYRENIRLEGTSGSTAAPIIVEAATKGSVIISGSDVWTGWTGGGSPAGTFVRPWPHKWGMIPYPNGWEGWVVLPDLVRRREMVFVNGQRLRQVASAEALAPSTFYVSEASQEVRIFPPAGVNLATALVEVPQRASLFLIQNRSNIVIRGLVMKHDNSALASTGALNVYNASNILIEDATLDWNNNRGLAIADTSRVTVRRTAANSNGAGGISGYKMLSTLFEDTESSNNNWRGFESGFTDWDPAGTKLLLLHNALLVRPTLNGNQAYGLWLDTDCVDVTIQGMTANENLNDGVFLEAIQGPVKIEGSSMSRNGRSGLLLGNAAAGTLSRSTLVDNREYQLLISGNPAGRPVDDFESGRHYAGIHSTGWSFTDNTIHGMTAAQSLVATTLPPSLWQAFVDSLLSDRNSWYNATNPRSFRVANGTRIDFESWKVQTRQDLHSVFSSTPVPQTPGNLRIVK